MWAKPQAVLETTLARGQDDSFVVLVDACALGAQLAADGTVEHAPRLGTANFLSAVLIEWEMKEAHLKGLRCRRSDGKRSTCFSWQPASSTALLGNCTHLS